MYNFENVEDGEQENSSLSYFFTTCSRNKPKSSLGRRRATLPTTPADSRSGLQEAKELDALKDIANILHEPNPVLNDSFVRDSSSNISESFTGPPVYMFKTPARSFYIPCAEDSPLDPLKGIINSPAPDVTCYFSPESPTKKNPIQKSLFGKSSETESACGISKLNDPKSDIPCSSSQLESCKFRQTESNSALFNGLASKELRSVLAHERPSVQSHNAHTESSKPSCTLQSIDTRLPRTQGGFLSHRFTEEEPASSGLKPIPGIDKITRNISALFSASSTRSSESACEKLPLSENRNSAEQSPNGGSDSDNKEPDSFHILENGKIKSTGMSADVRVSNAVEPVSNKQPDANIPGNLFRMDLNTESKASNPSHLAVTDKIVQNSAILKTNSHLNQNPLKVTTRNIETKVSSWCRSDNSNSYLPSVGLSGQIAQSAARSDGKISAFTMPDGKMSLISPHNSEPWYRHSLKSSTPIVSNVNSKANDTPVSYRNRETLFQPISKNNPLDKNVGENVDKYCKRSVIAGRHDIPVESETVRNAVAVASGEGFNFISQARPSLVSPVFSSSSAIESKDVIDGVNKERMEPPRQFPVNMFHASIVGKRPAPAEDKVNSAQPCRYKLFHTSITEHHRTNEVNNSAPPVDKTPNTHPTKRILQENNGFVKSSVNSILKNDLLSTASENSLLNSRNKEQSPNKCSNQYGSRREEIQSTKSNDVFKKPVSICHRSGKMPSNLPDKLCVNGIKYPVLNQLGLGGSSKVYQALTPDMTMVAIKCVDLSSVDQAVAKGYLNEINILAALQSSSSVIKMFNHEYQEDKERLYVVMEKGDTDFAHILKSYSNSSSKMTVHSIIYYWVEMLNCVNDIHKHGIIHSDLKPANFLLVAGRLKLIDFGVASSLQNDMTSVMKDITTGTFNYISPEAIVCHSERQRGHKISYKSDVWSLGCILYQLVYGRTPYSHVTQMWAKMQAIGDPKCVPKYPQGVEVPVGLEIALRWCLNKDAKRRPTTRQLLDMPYYLPSRNCRTGANIRSKLYEHIMEMFPDCQVNLE